MADGPFMLPDGRPLDDAERQDIPRLVAEVLDKVANLVERNTMTEEARSELVEQVRLLAATHRAWAELGIWPPKRCPHCYKGTV